MIGHLTGTIFESTRTTTIVDTGGVGYLVHVPEQLLSKLTPKTIHSFYIHTHVRDDALDLYGFDTRDELSIFELLLTVSGIGPRTALSIVNRGVSHIQHAVTTSDVEFFTTIPRLGKKNAQKIIIELKSKLGSIQDLDLSEDGSGETKDVLDALTHMGFGRSEVITAIKKLDPEDKTLEQKILHALKILGK